MRILSSTRRDAWVAVGLDDPALDADGDFLVAVVDELTDAIHERIGLPDLRLTRSGPEAAHGVVLDTPSHFEAVVPLAAPAGTIPVYVSATPGRLVVELHGAGFDLELLQQRMAWDADHPGATGAFLFLELVLRSFRSAMREVRSELDAVEEDLLDGTERAQLVELNALHRRVSAMRRDLSEYSDSIAETNELLDAAAAFPSDVAKLARAHAGSADSVLAALSVLRDEVANTMELHRSLTSSRQAEVINRLTVISALLLPLTFITGFFGMNFAWLTGNLTTALSFWILGVFAQIAVAGIVVVLMWRAGWLVVLRSDRPSAEPAVGRS